MNMDFPLFWGVDRSFDPACVERPDEEIIRRFDAFLPPSAAGLRGKRVAVCVGSRGIASLPLLVKTVIGCLKSRGASVYIVPAMGSHGGGTAAGQKLLLEGLGVTEEAMGVAIRPGMDVADLLQLPHGPVVRFSTEALKADFVVPICRVKEHTILTGDVQSGICKMIVIGCGKHAGAQEYHKYDISRSLVPSAQALIRRVPFLCSVAVVENAYDRICEIRIAKPEEFIETDRGLLRIAKRTLPRLPFESLDALVIDEIGKDISGAGADVNVIGKWRREGGPRTPNYAVLAVLGITPASHGNATGIGCMDLMPRRLLDVIDYDAMRINVLTSRTFRSARLPLQLEDDRAILRAILDSVPDRASATLARIRNTRDLQRFWATENALSLLDGDMRCTVDPEPQRCAFDGRGVWNPFA